MSDYTEQFEAVRGGETEVLTAALNYIENSDRKKDNEVFLSIDSFGEYTSVALSLDKAKEFRDHLNFLIEKAAYVETPVFDVNPADPAEYVSLAPASQDGDKFDFYPQPVYAATNTANFDGSVESTEFDAEVVATQIDDLYVALRGKGWSLGAAEKMCRAYFSG